MTTKSKTQSWHCLIRGVVIDKPNLTVSEILCHIKDIEPRLTYTRIHRIMRDIRGIRPRTVIDGKRVRVCRVLGTLCQRWCRR